MKANRRKTGRLTTSLILSLSAFAAACSSEPADTQAEPALSAELAYGLEVFEAYCGACHNPDMTGNGVAPGLRNIVGQKAGTDGFPFSQAFIDSEVIWTAETLEQFLETPRELIPGNQMAFYGIEEPEIRTAIVDYIVHHSE